MSAEPAFRCAVASQARADDLAGTATHVRALLLVEHHGPWGESVLSDSRLPPDVRRHLGGHGAVKVLLARRHHRAHRGATYAAFLCLPARRLLLRTTFTDPLELTSLDLAAVSRGEVPGVAEGWRPVDGPLYGVCTHGRHDACCAERGRPVVRALTEARPEQTWEVSHMGGDRFAANLVVLPEGLYYGRSEPGTVVDLVARHESGRLDLDLLRGSTTQPMPVQYAEIALRRHLGEDRLDAVRLHARNGDSVSFDHDGRRWQVVVRRLTDDPVRLTCGAARLNPLPVFETVSVQQVA